MAPALQVLLKVCGIFIHCLSSRNAIPARNNSPISWVPLYDRSPSLIVVPDPALFRTATVRPIRGPIILQVISVFLIVLLD